ncbi:MAG: hypothetical protein K8R99_13850 [Actinomycetia bacterium]|nr:hypothetical protein [Actinomycetes bacterium]
MRIDTEAFFVALADELNAHPEQFKVHGEADMVAALVMRKADGDFAVRVAFEGIRVEAVSEIVPADVVGADYYLDGPLPAWQAMFDDILANGAASGRLTINSLALLGTEIRLRGDDPMGVDKFSRFNQTLQEYLDGAARVAVAAG